MTDAGGEGPTPRQVRRTQAFYGRWARLYDHVADLPGVRSWRRRAAAALGLEEGDTALEMGCGTGANLPYLRERVGPRGRVLGLDLTAGMLAAAARRGAERGWANAHLVQGDATAPPVCVAPGEGVDGLLASFVLGMLPDPAAAVRDWCGLVRPGGRVALLEAGPTRWGPARPLNLPFRAFVWGAAPDRRRAGGAAARRLGERIEAARGALRAASATYRTERYGLGFVRLAVGTVPA